jgi:hypothetical protein
MSAFPRHGFFRSNWFVVASGVYGFATALEGHSIFDAVWWIGLTFGIVAFVGARLTEGDA